MERFWEHRIYLDNAATSFPKPAAVTEEMVRCMKEYCGNAGRGTHYYSRKASEMIYETREHIADMFGTDLPENIVFTFNTTYALNLAIKSLVKEGMHILISDMEHNSVLRPVEALKYSKSVKYSVFSTYLKNEDEIINNISRYINNKTGMLICQYASNICGTVLPIKRIGELCRKRGIYFIVDAAQSAGLFDIDIKDLGISALCFPSHKALLGPQGIGVIIFSEDIKNTGKLASVIEGGSGSGSKSLLMPEHLPDRFEVGTMPAPAIAGLNKGLEFVKQNKPEQIRAYEESLGNMLKSELLNMSKVRVYCAHLPSSIVLFNIRGLSSNQVSTELDDLGICTRSGYHCAPLAHETLKTGENGAVRISFGCFNDKKQVISAIDAIYNITAHR